MPLLTAQRMQFLHIPALCQPLCRLRFWPLLPQRPLRQSHLTRRVTPTMWFHWMSLSRPLFLHLLSRTSPLLRMLPNSSNLTSFSLPSLHFYFLRKKNSLQVGNPIRSEKNSQVHKTLLRLSHSIMSPLVNFCLFQFLRSNPGERPTAKRVRRGSHRQHLGSRPHGP